MSIMRDLERYRREVSMDRSLAIAEHASEQRDRLIAEMGAQAERTFDASWDVSRIAQASETLASEMSRMAAVADWALPSIVEHLAATAERLGGVAEMLANPTQTGAAELYRRGSYALVSGWLEEAESDLTSAVNVYPYNPRTWFQLGLARQRSENFDGAADAFSRCARYGVGADQALVARAILLAAFLHRKAGRTDAAAALLSDYADRIDNCAELHLASGVHDKSIRHLVRALTLAPEFTADIEAAGGFGLEEAAAIVRELITGPVRRLQAVELLMDQLSSAAQRAGVDGLQQPHVRSSLAQGNAEAISVASRLIPRAVRDIQRLASDIEAARELRRNAAARTEVLVRKARDDRVLAADRVSQIGFRIHQLVGDLRPTAPPAPPALRAVTPQTRPDFGHLERELKEAQDELRAAERECSLAQGELAAAESATAEAVVAHRDAKGALLQINPLLQAVTIQRRQAIEQKNLVGKRSGPEWERAWLSAEQRASESEGRARWLADREWKDWELREHKAGRDTNRAAWDKARERKQGAISHRRTEPVRGKSLKEMESAVHREAWVRTVEAGLAENVRIQSAHQRVIARGREEQAAQARQQSFLLQPWSEPIFFSARNRRVRDAQINALAEVLTAATRSRRGAEDEAREAHFNAGQAQKNAWISSVCLGWQQAVQQASAQTAQVADQVKIAGAHAEGLEQFVQEAGQKAKDLVQVRDSADRERSLAANQVAQAQGAKRKADREDEMAVLAHQRAQQTRQDEDREFRDAQAREIAVVEQAWQVVVDLGSEFHSRQAAQTSADDLRARSASSIGRDWTQLVNDGLDALILEPARENESRTYSALTESIRDMAAAQAALKSVEELMDTAQATTLEAITLATPARRVLPFAALEDWHS